MSDEVKPRFEVAEMVWVDSTFTRTEYGETPTICPAKIIQTGARKNGDWSYEITPPPYYSPPCYWPEKDIFKTYEEAEKELLLRVITINREKLEKHETRLREII